MGIEAKVKCDSRHCEAEVNLMAHDFSTAETQFYDLEEQGWSIDQDGVDLCPECNPNFDSDEARYEQALKVAEELIVKQDLNPTETSLLNEAVNFCEKYEAKQGW